eukprot:6625724-Pyramimonas_sp.AAC.1
MEREGARGDEVAGMEGAFNLPSGNACLLRRESSGLRPNSKRVFDRVKGQPEFIFAYAHELKHMLLTKAPGGAAKGQEGFEIIVLLVEPCTNGGVTVDPDQHIKLVLLGHGLISSETWIRAREVYWHTVSSGNRLLGWGS